MKEKYIDLIGMYAAILCLVHCLLSPLLFLLPIGISHNAFVDFLFLCIGLWPVYKISKGNSPRYLKVILWTSIVLIGISVALDAFFHIHSFLIYIGAIGLISGHLINFKCQKHEH